MLDNHVGSHGWLYKAVSLRNSYLSTMMYCFRISIIIDISVVSPGHGKYVVDGLNAREKRIPKLVMANLLNSKLIINGPKFSSSRRFIKMGKTKLQV